MYPVTSNTLTQSIILQWGQHSVVFCSEVSLQHEIWKNPQQKWTNYESDFLIVWSGLFRTPLNHMPHFLDYNMRKTLTENTDWSTEMTATWNEETPLVWKKQSRRTHTKWTHAMKLSQKLVHLVFVSYYRNNSMQEKCTVSGCIITDRSIWKSKIMKCFSTSPVVLPTTFVSQVMI